MQTHIRDERTEMGTFAKLELSTETIRELTQGELTQVAGGAAAAYTNASGCQQTTQTAVCPSGATWFTSCEPDLLSRNC